MNATIKIDAARVELLLSELRLPGIKLIWAALAETADKEGWPAARFLAALAEQEMVERSRRRFERHLEEARLPPGKTLDAFDFDAVPMISKAQVQALAAGDAWLEKGANLLCFRPAWRRQIASGGGARHGPDRKGLARVVHQNHRSRAKTPDRTPRSGARSGDRLKLDKYHLLILDDLAYVTKDQAETSVLFELISARYERRSMLITANQPFAEWEDLPGSSHDPRGHRSPRPPRHDPRNECRQLSPERGCRQSPWSWTSANARDNQDVILIVAPRQSNHPSPKYSLRYRRVATIILSPRPPKWPS